jgi:hypothetical protein
MKFSLLDFKVVTSDLNSDLSLCHSSWISTNYVYRDET